MPTRQTDAGAVSTAGGPPRTAAADDARTEGTKGQPPDWKALPAWLWRLPIAGLVVVLIFAFTEKPLTEAFASVFAIGSLIGGAALMAGGLLGFLFGIPRNLQGDRSGEPTEPSADPRPRAEYGGNTNLEQISDWLTKILVGAGLVQIGSLTGSLRKLANDLGASLGDSSAAPDFAMAALVYFAACGFLIAYLWTRLNLPQAFAHAEGLLSVQRELKTFKASVEKQAEHDARALSLLARQLDPEQENVPEQQLNEAVAAASTPFKVQIFGDARNQRHRAWKDEDLHKIQRTIPIFRALIASDTENRFHRHFAQLGYALKDQQERDYVEAERRLSEAIGIRGPRGGFRIYEFARAECRIGQGPPAGGDATAYHLAIRDDLAVAAADQSLLDKISKPGSAFKRWMTEQGITVKDLLTRPAP